MVDIDCYKLMRTKTKVGFMDSVARYIFYLNNQYLQLTTWLGKTFKERNIDLDHL